MSILMAQRQTPMTKRQRQVMKRREAYYKLIFEAIGHFNNGQTLASASITVGKKKHWLGVVLGNKPHLRRYLKRNPNSVRDKDVRLAIKFYNRGMSLERAGKAIGYSSAWLGKVLKCHPQYQEMITRPKGRYP